MSASNYTHCRDRYDVYRAATCAKLGAAEAALGMMSYSTPETVDLYLSVWREQVAEIDTESAAKIAELEAK